MIMPTIPDISGVNLVLAHRPFDGETEFAFVQLEQTGPLDLESALKPHRSKLREGSDAYFVHVTLKEWLRGVSARHTELVVRVYPLRGQMFTITGLTKTQSH
jgi:hypothetical protein